MKIRIIFKNLHDCIEISQFNNDNIINSSAQSSHKVSIFNGNTNSNTTNTASTRINEVQVNSNDYVIDYVVNSNVVTALPTLNTALQSASHSPNISAVNSVRQSGQGQLIGNNNLFSANTSAIPSLRKEPDSRGTSPNHSPYMTSNTIIPVVNNNKIADIKYSLAEQFNLKADSIMLFTYTDRIRKVRDNEEISNFIFIKNGNAIFAVFYFKIEKADSPNDSIKVCVDFYQNNIDKIVYDISPSCSVYLLKYMLNKKLKNTFPIAEQTLVFSSIGNTSNLLNDSIMSKRRFSTGSNANNANNYQLYNNNNSNNSTLFTSHSHMKINNGSMLKDLKDDLSIKEILDKVTGNVNSTSLNSNNLNNSVVIGTGNIYQNTILNLLLIRKGNKKCSIGLDFSFTFMRNMRKINFDQDAPSFREVSDGLNFFCYCINKDCKLFNQMFVRNLGYDKFDMVKEMRVTQCPICHERNNDIRSLGFINAEWTYRGMLINKHNSIISGDGITIDSKLYVMNETNLLGQMDKMEMVVKETQSKKDKKFQYDFDLNLDSAAGSDEDVDPLKDLDVQFSVKRKDLFPEVSSRTNYSKPTSLLNFNTNTNSNTNGNILKNNQPAGSNSGGNVSSTGIITSNNVNLKSKTNLNLNTSLNLKKENQLNNVKSNNISANVTQLDEDNTFIKEGKIDDGFVIKLDNTKSNNCCFGGGRIMKTDKDAKGGRPGVENNEKYNYNDKSCLIY